MKFKINNKTGSPVKYENEIQSLCGFAKDRLGFQKPPSIFLNHDERNAGNTLGKTGHYDPNTMEIHVFATGRHPKDILRSIAHELVHHNQNEHGHFDDAGYSGKGYAQKNPHLRKMEREANDPMLFRDWEDSLKEKENTIYNERRNRKMSLKEWKNKELSENLNKKWGFKMNLNALGDDKEITHMCALHVIHESTGKEGHPIKHTLDENGKVSHYTVEFDDVIVENIPVGNLKILQQEMHSHKRDDEKKSKGKNKEVVSEDELEEEEHKGKEEEGDDVAARTPPRDKKNKTDFLPKPVRDKINAKAKKGKK